jgi:hypothetical protein
MTTGAEASFCMTKRHAELYKAAVSSSILDLILESSLSTGEVNPARIIMRDDAQKWQARCSLGANIRALLASRQPHTFLVYIAL